MEKLELFETSVADLKLAGAGGAIEVVEIALDRELAAPDAARLAGLPTGIGGHAVEVRLFKTEARLERPVVRLRPALELAAQRPARERGGQLGQREFARVPDERRAHILQDQRLRPDEALDVREALDLGPRDRRAGDAHSGAGERAFAVVVEELHGAAFDLEPRNVEDWSAFLFLLRLPRIRPARFARRGLHLLEFREPPFSFGVLLPHELRGVHADLRDGEFSNEQRQQAVARGEGACLEKICAALRDRDAGDPHAAPEREAGVREFQRHAQRLAELRLNPLLRARRLDVAVQAQGAENDHDKERPESEENSLGMFFHGAQPNCRTSKEKVETPARHAGNPCHFEPCRPERAGKKDVETD